MPITEDVIANIVEERVAQDLKWGVQNHQHEKWLAILVEELGEVAKDVLETKPIWKIREELVQVAAVAVAWVEHLDRQ